MCFPCRVMHNCAAWMGTDAGLMWSPHHCWPISTVAGIKNAHLYANMALTSKQETFCETFSTHSDHLFSHGQGRELGGKNIVNTCIRFCIRRCCCLEGHFRLFQVASERTQSQRGAPLLRSAWMIDYRWCGPAKQPLVKRTHSTWSHGCRR